MQEKLISPYRYPAPYALRLTSYTRPHGEQLERALHVQAEAANHMTIYTHISNGDLSHPIILISPHRYTLTP